MTTNLAASNNTNCLSQFLRVSCMGQLRSHKTAIKVSAGAGAYLSLRFPFQAHACCCQNSVPWSWRTRGGFHLLQGQQEKGILDLRLHLIRSGPPRMISLWLMQSTLMRNLITGQKPQGRGLDRVCTPEGGNHGDPLRILSPTQAEELDPAEPSSALRLWTDHFLLLGLCALTCATGYQF